MIAYKVTKEDMTSCITSPSKFKIQYEFDKLILPRVKGAELFVFSTLEAAKNFVTGFPQQRIFKVEVPSLRPAIDISDYDDSEDMVQFWESGGVDRVFDKAPSGTHFAPSLKIIEEIIR